MHLYKEDTNNFSNKVPKRRERKRERQKRGDIGWWLLNHIKYKMFNSGNDHGNKPISVAKSNKECQVYNENPPATNKKNNLKDVV